MKRSPGVTVPKLTPHCRLFPAVPTALRCDPLLPSLPRSGGWRENATSCRRGPFACLRNLCLKPLPPFPRARSYMPGNLCLVSLPQAIPCERRKENLNSIDCFEKSPAPTPAHGDCPAVSEADAEGCGQRPAGKGERVELWAPPARPLWPSSAALFTFFKSQSTRITYPCGILALGQVCGFNPLSAPPAPNFFGGDQ